MKVFCPYCSSTNNVALVCSDKKNPTNSSYAINCNQNRLKRKEAILANYNFHYSKNYDGSIIKRSVYDRYCFECEKPFYYVSNLIISDIKYLIFVVETKNEKWKYEIFFDEENSFYNIDHNYITKEYQTHLTKAQKKKILQCIDNSKLLSWKASGDQNRLSYLFKWNVYVYFFNEQVYARGGYDEYPKLWNDFINVFIKIFKSDFLIKMKQK